MNRNTTVRARMEEDLKSDVETVFQQLGLTTTEAITLFYKQVQLHRGLPFPVRIPNEETRKTFEATDRGEDLVHCKDLKDFCKKLGLDEC
ncbi:type II toxin-antitoxin system RelB/DinJ family antitoxin [Endozoicomonas sp.]|uniref:type II toxin-antitoxin system RelB/DinJ family antitoxin n=1 Tax=Endozoicomonas sp. TaxID=1892382 RepID=UPI00383A45E0